MLSVTRRNRLAVLCAGAVVLASGSTYGLLHRDGSSSTPPSLSKLTTEISQGAKLKTANLNTTIPPLSSIEASSNTLPGMPSGCFSTSESSVPSNATTLCAFGDLDATHVIYVLGDSQAAMWLNALNPIAVSLHYRIVFTAETGCPPWPGQLPANYIGENEASCVTFVQSEISLMEKLKPTVVIPLGDGFNDGKGVWVARSAFASSIEQLWTDASGSKFLLLGPIPMYTSLGNDVQPTSCLASYPNDIQKCEYSPTAMIDTLMLGAFAEAAKAKKFPFVSVQPLFCTSKRCDVIVENHIVFRDSDHAARTYILWVQSALQSLIAKDL